MGERRDASSSYYKCYREQLWRAAKYNNAAGNAHLT
jgi:hypothetical protein